MVHQHLKRLAMPKSWPIGKKKNKFTTRLGPGSHTSSQSMPLTTILREVIGSARDSKEVKYILRKNKVFVGYRRRTDHKFPVGLFEVISLPEAKEYYRLLYTDKGKLTALKVDESDAKHVPAKILTITQVRGGKFQYGLFGGRNVLLDKISKDYHVGDTLVLDEKGKVTKHLPLKKSALVYFIDGKFQGTTATVDDVQGDTIIVTTDNETAKTLTSYAYVVGEKHSIIKLV